VGPLQQRDYRLYIQFDEILNTPVYTVDRSFRLLLSGQIVEKGSPTREIHPFLSVMTPRTIIPALWWINMGVLIHPPTIVRTLRLDTLL
jgi:hypothetical protein